eukprot:TRINITY_DN5612_c0_g1_i3.p1 TRINITY_DN5612_c0_g1~~TRINITY_DN5612_c0_g1_i3.p1  ORF type:complete len:174 (-),score=33.79 TRINITY_DN5612_c0_g1_i3:121-642(-)
MCIRDRVSTQSTGTVICRDMAELNTTGHCYCGAVKFSAKGAMMFSALCHCRACSRNTGVCPVHLIAIPEAGLEVTSGAELIKVAKGYGTMTHAFCTECGSPVYQCPEGAPFRALFPASFDTSHEDDKVCMLPSELQPTKHVNYENRTYDHTDNLDKFLVFGPAACTNSGEPIE